MEYMLLHSSPDPNLQRNWKSGSGKLGGALFFAGGWDRSDAYVMTAKRSITVYALDEAAQEKLKIAKRYELELSDDLIDRLEFFRAADDSWGAQADLLAAAVAEGYDGVEDEDEQGAVYILDGNSVIDMMKVI